MRVRYQRDMNHNYLVILGKSDIADVDYQVKMLMNNNIEGILNFHTRQVDNKLEYYYEISSKQPLSRILERRFITADEIRTILWRINAIIGETEKYLLDYNKTILKPDYIYLDPEAFKIYLCLDLEGEGEFSDSLRELLQIFLKKVNHEDNESVALAYNLYQETVKDNFKMENLMRLSGKCDISSDIADVDINSDKDEQLYDIQNNNPNSIYFKKTIQEKVNFDKVNDKKANSCSRVSYKPNALYSNYIIPLIVMLISIIGLFKYIEANIYDETFEDNAKVIVCVCAVVIFINIVIMKKFRSYRKYKLIVGESDSVIDNNDYDITCDVKKKQSTDNIPSKKGDYLAEKSISAKNNNSDNLRKKRKIILDFDIKAEDNIETEPQDEYLDFDLEEDESVNLENSKFTENSKTMLLYEEKSTLDMIRKLVSKDKSKYENIEIDKFPFILGKLQEFTDYQIQDDCVSRLHLKIDEIEGDYYITDLNSTNGTFINGYRLESNEQRQINIGDEIKVANINYKFT